ncbi:hypothetical protein SCUP234_04428 [Seiridium cupressi]
MSEVALDQPETGDGYGRGAQSRVGKWCETSGSVRLGRSTDLQSKVLLRSWQSDNDPLLQPVAPSFKVMQVLRGTASAFEPYLRAEKRINCCAVFLEDGG